jgi:ABC-type glycerol-3-phosphate transport system substrate-binding protein
MKYRIFAVLILTALMLSGCAGGTAEDGAVSSSDTIADETGSYLETLPQTDFEGAPFNVLCRDYKVYEIWTESLDGEVVNDALHERNSRIGEMFNTEITHTPVAGAWDTQQTFKDAVTSSVLSGDMAYDLVAGYLAYTTTLAMDGYFLNLYELPLLDLSREWWAQGFVENNTINGRAYYTAGDISLTMWEYMYGMFFNKRLAENYNTGDLYSAVNEGRWTHDTFAQKVKLVSQDLDGDGAYTNLDLYGYITNAHSVRNLITTFDIPIAARNEEGSYSLVFYTDKTVEVYNNMFEFLYNDNTVFFSKPADDADYVEILNMFMEDRALFFSGTLDNTGMLRGMEADFGILPFPKYNENQESYLSHSYDGMSIFAVPKTVKSVEMSGLITEALCAESRQTTVPAFYETVLQTKVVRDDESAGMIDLIRNTLRFDFGYVNSVPAGGMFQLFGDSLKGEVENFVSTYEARAKEFETNFQKIVDAYMELED